MEVSEAALGKAQCQCYMNTSSLVLLSPHTSNNSNNWDVGQSQNTCYCTNLLVYHLGKEAVMSEVA